MLQEPAVQIKTEVEEGNTVQQDMISGRQPAKNHVTGKHANLILRYGNEKKATCQ